MLGLLVEGDVTHTYTDCQQESSGSWDPWVLFALFLTYSHNAHTLGCAACRHRGCAFIIQAEESYTSSP